jgi:hypothetical protein
MTKEALARKKVLEKIEAEVEVERKVKADGNM